ncbi:MAG TPA: hypothetical protein VGZ23_08340 [bacterium]|nr:hypothetical protein [bacterium]
MTRRRRTRSKASPARIPARPRRARSRPAAPRPSTGSLAEVLKFQETSTAALRAVKMPMATEPSFLFKP